MNGAAQRKRAEYSPAVNIDVPCDDCLTIAEHPLGAVPLHVVHPEHGKPMVYDSRSEAICPACGTIWHRGTDNRARIVLS